MARKNIANIVGQLKFYVDDSITIGILEHIGSKGRAVSCLVSFCRNVVNFQTIIVKNPMKIGNI